MQLRERQIEAIHGGEFGPGVLKQWETHQSTLVVAATGFGKTILFSAIADMMRSKGRIMILTHRDKLLWQAKDKLAEFGIECDIEMGEFKANTGDWFKREAVIMTVQSGQSGRYQKRVEKFDPFEFSLVIADECHHFIAPQFRNNIDHFRKNPDCKILGVTATPDRSDEKALGQVFESVAYVYGIQRAVQDGWLVPPTQQFVEIEGLDYSNVRTTAGDLNGGDLAKILEQEEHCQSIAGSLISIVKDRTTLVFCNSVRQAELTSDILNRHQPGCSDWIYAKTPSESREQIYSAFSDRRVQYLCNVGIATEGYDNPIIGVVAIDRPTKSRALYEQMIGRGERALPGVVDSEFSPEGRKLAIAASPKPELLVLDFVGNSGRHKLMTVADVLGGIDSINTEVNRRIRTSGKPANVAQEMELMFRESQEREERDRHKKAGVKAKVQFSTTFVDPFNLFEVSPARSSRIDGCSRLSGLQLNVLTKAGYDPATLSSTQGKQLIGQLMQRRGAGLATPKQVGLLRKKGVPNPEAMPFTSANALINQIASNGWKYEERMLSALS